MYVKNRNFGQTANFGKKLKFWSKMENVVNK